MKKLLKFSFLALAANVFISCGDTQSRNHVTVSHPQPQDIAVETNDVPGFDINEFSELLKTTSNPEALTQQLNNPGNSINNLDLDEDGNIDYLKVDQISANQLGVYDETPNGKVTVATLTVNTNNNSYVVSGSPTYSGDNYMYRSEPGLSLGEFMFLHYMMTPHTHYHPSWGYRSGYYSGYSPRTYTSTRTTRTVSRPATTTSAKYSNTKYNNSSSNTMNSRNSISKPTQSQKSFTSGESDRFKNSGTKTSAFSTPSRTTTASRPAATPRNTFGSTRNTNFGSSSSSSSSSRSYTPSSSSSSSSRSFGSSSSSSSRSFGSSRSSGFSSSRKRK